MRVLLHVTCSRNDWPTSQQVKSKKSACYISRGKLTVPKSMDMQRIELNLKDVQRQLGARKSMRTKAAAGDIATALLWGTNAARLEKLTPPKLSGEIHLGYVGEQPATLFVGHGRAVTNQLFNDIASFAYHSAIEWGVVSNGAETTIFNSHWVSGDEWFQLPAIPAKSLMKNSRLLSGLTPRGLSEGSIYKMALELKEPDVMLSPVDEALVDTLDNWRGETLRHSSNIIGIEEKLQLLFTQLFILRMVEDRGLGENLAPLSTVLQPDGTANQQELARLFLLAGLPVQGELFQTPPPTEIPPFIIGGIIGDLYYQRERSSFRHKYNFAWLSADILGRAYQKYLSTVFVPNRALSPQLDLFNSPLRVVEQVSRQKASGVYYTPEFLVRFLTERAIDKFYATPGVDQFEFPKIADLACGSGSFLVAGTDILIRRLKAKRPDVNWAEKLLASNSIIGFDIDPRAVSMTRLALWFRLAEEPQPLPLPNLESCIKCADALLSDSVEELQEKLDIVLGNPPFLATTAITDRSEIVRRYKSASGRFDYSFLFLELAIKLLRVNGVVSLVLPNRLFHNTYGEEIRSIVTSKTHLLTVVDFGSTEVFDGVQAYVGLLVAQKEHQQVDVPVRVIKLSTSNTRWLGAQLALADQNKDEVSKKGLSAYWARQPHGPGPWNFLSKSDTALLIRIQEQGILLQEIAEVRQGIKTGANDIFIVEQIDAGRSSVIRVVNGLGTSFLLERAALRPVIYGAEIQRYGGVSTSRLLVYPNEGGVPIPLQEIEKRFPLLFEYFTYYKSELESRSSIANKKHWHELGSARNEAWLNAPKIITRDLANEPSFAPDERGAVFLVGGTAVVPKDDSSLYVLLGFLNSIISRWQLSNTSSEYQSGFTKFEPRHIAPLFIPTVLFEQSSRDIIEPLVLDILAAKASGHYDKQIELEADLDEQLCEIVKIPRPSIR